MGIYGVIPYVSPEIFKGGVFSKESDMVGINNRSQARHLSMLSMILLLFIKLLMEKDL
jgi:hypothetical protein